MIGYLGVAAGIVLLIFLMQPSMTPAFPSAIANQFIPQTSSIEHLLHVRSVHDNSVPITMSDASNGTGSQPGREGERDSSSRHGNDSISCELSDTEALEYNLATMLQNLQQVTNYFGMKKNDCNVAPDVLNHLKSSTNARDHRKRQVQMKLAKLRSLRDTLSPNSKGNHPLNGMAVVDVEMDGIATNSRDYLREINSSISILSRELETLEGEQSPPCSEKGLIWGSLMRSIVVAEACIRYAALAASKLVSAGDFPAVVVAEMERGQQHWLDFPPKPLVSDINGIHDANSNFTREIMLDWLKNQCAKSLCAVDAAVSPGPPTQAVYTGFGPKDLRAVLAQQLETLASISLAVRDTNARQGQTDEEAVVTMVPVSPISSSCGGAALHLHPGTFKLNAQACSMKNMAEAIREATFSIVGSPSNVTMATENGLWTQGTATQGLPKPTIFRITVAAGAVAKCKYYFEVAMWCGASDIFSATEEIISLAETVADWHRTLSTYGAAAVRGFDKRLRQQHHRVLNPPNDLPSLASAAEMAHAKLWTSFGFYSTLDPFIVHHSEAYDCMLRFCESLAATANSKRSPQCYDVVARVVAAKIHLLNSSVATMARALGESVRLGPSWMMQGLMQCRANLTEVFIFDEVSWWNRYLLTASARGDVHALLLLLPESKSDDGDDDKYPKAWMTGPFSPSLIDEARTVLKLHNELATAIDLSNESVSIVPLGTLAAFHGHKEFIKAFIESSRAKEKPNLTAILSESAAAGGRLSIVQLLLEHGAVPTNQPLRAASSGLLDVTHLLQFSSTWGTVSQQVSQHLMKLVCSHVVRPDERVALVSWLMNTKETSALLDTADDDGFNGPLLTALAASAGYKEVLQRLIAAGHTSSLIPILAAARGHVHLLKWLSVDNGAISPSVSKKRHAGMLKVATSNGHAPATLWLMSAMHRGVNEQDAEGNTPLHIAAEHGHIKLVRALVLDAHARVDITRNDGRTPLEVAILGGHTDVVRALIFEAGARADWNDELGPLLALGTPVFPDIVAILLEEGSGEQSGFLSALNFAVASKSSAVAESIVGYLMTHGMHQEYDGVCEKLVPLGVDIGNVELLRLLMGTCGVLEILKLDCSEENFTTLHTAASKGHTELAMWLVDEMQWDPSAATTNGSMPFQIACLQGHYTTAKWLLARIAGIMDAFEEKSLLEIAVRVGRVDLLRWLLDHNVNDNVHDKTEGLHVAIVRPNVEITRTLLAAGADVNGLVSGLAALHIAAQVGSINMATLLISEAGDSLDVRDNEGRTPFHWAAWYCRLTFMMWMTEEHAVSPDVVMADGSTALHVAAVFGYLDVIQWLVNKAQVDVEARRNDGATALQLAALGGHHEAVQWLVEQAKVDIHPRMAMSGSTPLHSGATSSKANVQALKHLVHAGADINARDVAGATPLHYLAERGNAGLLKEIAQELGADVHVSRDDGMTALHLAVIHNSLAVIETLVHEFAADIDRVNNDGTSALALAIAHGHMNATVIMMQQTWGSTNWEIRRDKSVFDAVKYGNLDILRWLVGKAGASLNIIDDEYRTPLHIAAWFSHIPLMVWMVGEHAVSPDVRIFDGSTALHVAAEQGNLDTVHWLVNTGQAEVDARRFDDLTPLHLAALGGHVEVVQWLVEVGGADIHAVGGDMSILRAAVMEGHWPIVKYLVRAGADIKDRRIVGFSLAHEAVFRGHGWMLKGLVDELGANAHAVTLQGKTLLHVAAEQDDLEAAKLLVNEYGIDPTATTLEGKDAFHVAVEGGSTKCVRWMIESLGVDANLPRQGLLTPITAAIDARKIDMVELLMELGADLNTIPQPQLEQLSNGTSVGHAIMGHKLIEARELRAISTLYPHMDPVYWALINHWEDVVLDAIRKGEASPHLSAEGMSSLALYAAYEGDLDMLRALVLEHGISAGSIVSNETRESLLHAAAQRGHLTVAKWLIEEAGVEVGVSDNMGNQPLHFACRFGHLEVVKWLISQAGASVDTPGSYGNYPLHEAAEMDQALVAQWLVVEGGSKFGVLNSDVFTPLQVAALRGHSRTIAALLEAGGNPNEPLQGGGAVLHLAVSRGHVSAISALLEAGANPESTWRGHTTLHVAAFNGLVDAAATLVRKGNANLLSFNEEGHTPLHAAVLHNHPSVIRWLVLQGGMSTATRSRDGFTPLHTAVQSRGVESIRELVEVLSADVGAGDASGATPLHLAVALNETDMVRLLVLEFGANPSIGAADGDTPFHWSVKKGLLEISRFLAANGAQVDGQNSGSSTALHQAVSRGDKVAAEFLVKELAADVDAVQIYECTPLFLAALGNHDAIGSFLVKEGGSRIDFKKTKNQDALRMAIETRQWNTVMATLQSGVKSLKEVVRAKPEFLCSAIAVNNMTFVKILVEGYEADVRGDGSPQGTPILVAAAHGHLHIVEWLVKDKGIDVNMARWKGETLKEVIKEILTGRTSEATLLQGTTAVHEAALHGHVDVLRWLIHHGADVKAERYDGITALHLAASEGHVEVVSLLIRNGARVDAKARSRGTPAIMAARSGNVEALDVLWRQGGASSAWKLPGGYSILHAAAQGAYVQVIEWAYENSLLTPEATETFVEGWLAPLRGFFRKFMPATLPLHPDDETEDGSTALHCVAEAGEISEERRIEFARFLVKLGADVRKERRNGDTAVDLVITNQSIRFLLFLVNECGAYARE